MKIFTVYVNQAHYLPLAGLPDKSAPMLTAIKNTGIAIIMQTDDSNNKWFVCCQDWKVKETTEGAQQSSDTNCRLLKRKRQNSGSTLSKWSTNNQTNSNDSFSAVLSSENFSKNYFYLDSVASYISPNKHYPNNVLQSTVEIMILSTNEELSAECSGDIDIVLCVKFNQNYKCHLK